MTALIKKLLGMNWVIVVLAVLLPSAGVVAVYTATDFRTEDFWQKQFVWAVAGLIVFILTSLIRYRFIKWIAVPMYLVATGMIILTEISLSEWRSEPLLPIRLSAAGGFLPSQLVVLGGILTLGWFLSRFQNLHPVPKLGLVGAIVGGPMFLIFDQPDFGTTLVWAAVVLSMVFAAGIPMRYFLPLLVLTGAAIPVILTFGLQPYQRLRIMTVFDPEIDPFGVGWATDQSLVAIRSAGWAGKGFLATGAQLERGFVAGTTVHSDYIFTAIAEQFGFVGGGILLSLFAVLLLAMLVTAYHAADKFGLLISVGFTAQIFFHVYQNVGMTIALMPVTGLPLPFLSYGGAFLVMTMFNLGLVNSVWVHRKDLPVKAQTRI